MPNWVTNKFTVFGDNVILKEIESTKFEFGNIIPIPEKVKHISDQEHKLGLGYIYEGIKTDNIEKQKVLQKWRQDFMDNHIWYNKNWNGEFWAHDLDIKWINNNTLKVSFNTRWSPADEIIKHLTQIYPVKIKLFAYEHVNFDVWNIIYENGKTISFKHEVDTSVYGNIDKPIPKEVLETLR